MCCPSRCTGALKQQGAALSPLLLLLLPDNKLASCSWKRMTMRCPSDRTETSKQQGAATLQTAHCRAVLLLQMLTKTQADLLQLEACDDALPLSSHGGLEAAGRRPGVEAGVVYVPQVHAHQPEAQRCVLYRRELQPQ